MGRIFALLTLLLISGSGFAQMKIGLKIAPQLTWATSDNKNTVSNGTRLNAAYGLMIDYYFSESYAIGTEICVNSFGANMNILKNKYAKVIYNSTTYTNTGDVQTDYKFQYFQIPVLIKMRTKEVNSMRYYAEFGFGLGFQFKSKADVSFGNQSLSNVDVNNPDATDNYTVYSSSQNFTNTTNSFRGSLIIGAGIHHAMTGGSALVLGVRYDNGLSSFMSDDKLSTSLHFIALNFGLLF